ncbi:MAG: G8 domain-containing protein [Isosphaeraceae bacterium]
MITRIRLISPTVLLLVMFGSSATAVEPLALVRSIRDGRWSNPATWEGGRLPGSGARVQVRAGHTVVYDIHGDFPIRSIHVAGTLRFDPEKDTRLDVGLIKIQAGDDAGESGFNCEAHVMSVKGSGANRSTAALEVGTPAHPVAVGHTALIRLTAVDGLDPEECPAIICCGGRMDFHGAELERTWVKLGATAARGASTVVLARPIPGWRVGDRVIITATNRQRVPDEGDFPSVRHRPETEERVIRAIDDRTLTIDAPLGFSHTARDVYRGEVALLSRNVVVESAAPAGVRGHTMYHRDSSGSISYAEFRHLGKAGKLGKYSLHFHRVGDTMRGASVIGASIWDSDNRWITIHGTNGLVVRDCVGYQALGHGFFLEDGSEVDNILDGNLAVQALQAKPLPDQILAFDRNEGAGFWWANSGNAFLRNVAVECDQYGFRYEAPAVAGFDPTIPVRSPDSSRRPVDIRTLPFVVFRDNEAHAQRRYGVNLGGGPGNGAKGGVGGVGPDRRHPSVVRGLRVWDARWAFSPAAPGILVDGLELAYSNFGIWRPHYDRQSYRNLRIYQTGWAYFAEEGQRPDMKKYPAPLDPIDDRPPFSVITWVDSLGSDRLIVRGTSVDDGLIRIVRVNGRAARALAEDYSRWEVEIDVDRPGQITMTLVAEAKDGSGNAEQVPHRIEVPVLEPDRHPQ